MGNLVWNPVLSPHFHTAALWISHSYATVAVSDTSSDCALAEPDPQPWWSYRCLARDQRFERFIFWQQLSTKLHLQNVFYLPHLSEQSCDVRSCLSSGRQKEDGDRKDTRINKRDTEWRKPTGLHMKLHFSPPDVSTFLFVLWRNRLLKKRDKKSDWCVCDYFLMVNLLNVGHFRTFFLITICVCICYWAVSFRLLPVCGQKRCILLPIVSLCESAHMICYFVCSFFFFFLKSGDITAGQMI